ncbi:MAG TPA: hypothetical protein VMU30_08465 [Bacteroidota bacterium]|nr:hypothetical protein [Bacteroidota bacterium]
MNTTNPYTIVPEGELRCVWMDAGVVEFKLCDRELECESCKFHKQRTIHHAPETSEIYFSSPHPSSANSATTKDLFTHLVKSQFERLLLQQLPDDRGYHRNHFWIQKKPIGNKYVLGIDHAAADFFRPILSIVFAPVPAIVKQNDPVCWLVTTVGTIPVRSPLNATITSYNPLLTMQSGLLDSDSYKNGWLMELTAKARAKGLDEFVEHRAAQHQFERQLHNLECTCMDAFHHTHPDAGMTMNDGGVVVNSIQDVFGQTIYYNIISRLL